MLNPNVNYPYPLLRPETIDYDKSKFDAEIMVEPTESGYKITVEYVIDDADVQMLLDQNNVAFGIEIQCKSTWFRKFEMSKAAHQTVMLPADLVHNTVNICPCIVSVQDIKNFKSKRFAVEYVGIQFDLNCGEVIAIGNEKKFEAVYEMDIINSAESIINISSDEKISEQECDFNDNIINIKLPKEEYDIYNTIGMGQSRKREVLIAIYCVPALVEAIRYINDDEADYSNFAWYKTLKIFIEKIAKGNKPKIVDLLEQPLRTVQLLLDNNSKKAINILLRNEDLE